MKIEDLKVAAYLDQVSEDPVKAIGILSELGLKNVIIRRAWTNNICNVNDNLCAKIRGALLHYNMKVVLICSDIGNSSCNELMKYEGDLERLITICKFFSCKYAKVGIGKKSADPRSVAVYEAWLKTVDRKFADNNIAPCLEINYDSVATMPAEVASILHKYKRWQVIYDPAILVQTRSIDPFTRYWSLLKNRVSHVDVRDFVTGQKPAMPGHGDAKLDLVLSDVILSKHPAWLCLEPNAGRKLGKVSGLDNVFKMSLDAFKSILQRLDLGQEVKNI